MNSVQPIENQPQPARQRKISKRVRHAIDLMSSGQCRTQKAAAERAGLTRERLCRALKESHVQKYITDQTRVFLASAQPTAVATLMHLMDAAKSEHVQKDVATTILGFNGITAGGNGPVVSIGLQVGYVIDLSPCHAGSGPVIDMTERASATLDDEPATASIAYRRSGER